MNKKYRLYWAILIPIIFFFIALWIATSNNRSPFDLNKTWGTWLLYLLGCWLVEYEIFGQPKNKIFDWPLEIFMWVYTIILHSLVFLIILAGISWVAQPSSAYTRFYEDIMNFPWSIKIPLFIVGGIVVYILRNTKK